MNQCPVCSSEIQDAFGLVECPSCRKILFADFDGTLKVHEDAPVQFGMEQDVPVHELNEETNDADFNTNWNLIKETPPPSLDVLDPVVEVDADVSTSQSSAILEEVSEASFSEIEESIEVSKESGESLNAIEEINQFANSPASSLKEGNLVYNLTIKNIDTEELKQEIMAVLKENKLGIDTKKLKFALPTLELKDLNPVKVSVIVSKIKHLPIDMEWAQKSIITNEESSLD